MVSHIWDHWTAMYARYFTSRGATVCVVSFSPGTIDGIQTEYVGIDPWEENKRAFFTRVPRVRKIIRRFGPDVVLATYVASNGIPAVLGWKGPTVVSARGGDVLEQAGRAGVRRWLREALVRFICKRAALVHTVSHEMDELLMRLGIPASKIICIPLGVDTERFSPAPDVPRPLARHLVCTRKHEDVYDNFTIIEALARLKAAGRDFTFAFAAAGPQTEAYKTRVAELDLADRVSFAGNLTPKQMPDFLRRADIYISASLSDGTSSCLLEAMAAGLMPVVTRIRANEPWIEHGHTGLLFEPRSVDGLAESLMRAMDDSSLRQRAFAENRRRIEANGKLARNMERFAEAVENLVSQAART
jgi:glycosyltransferase involved in cell wall biosynthesis